MNLSTRNKIDVTAGMSTMTDLVFLLLIFFIIISTLVSNGLNVDLPSAQGTTSASPSLTLSITSDGTYHFNGGGAFAHSELESRLTAMMSDQTEKIVYLQVDKSVPTGQTVEVIGIAKAHSWKIMLGSNPE
tara:strand:+ start:1352 stop:1744 length:393 start_codon:yes stop_codon:yes gene_type:complete